MTQKEKDSLLKKIDSIYGKTVKAGWDYMEGRDNALSELRVFVNNMDVRDEEEFEKWCEEMNKELEKDPNYINPEDKLQRFYHDNCEGCGTQRCLGVYDREWREGCTLYKKEFESKQPVS